MSGASIETTLELWASSLREVKRRMRPLFTQERVARSAEHFLDGLLGEERRKTGWMRAEAAGEPGPWRQQAILGRGQWDADALRDIVRDYALETLAADDAVLVVDETGFLKQRQPAAFVPARRRLLVDVGLAPVNTAAIHVARRAVRHVAPAADQDRRARRRDEDGDQDSFAHIVLRTGHLALRARKNPASRHLSGRGRRPENQTRPVNPQTLPLRTLAMPPVTKMCAGATENSRSNRSKTSPQAARSSKRCIMRARRARHVASSRGRPQRRFERAFGLATPKAEATISLRVDIRADPAIAESRLKPS